MKWVTWRNKSVPNKRVQQRNESSASSLGHVCLLTPILVSFGRTWRPCSYQFGHTCGAAGWAGVPVSLSHFPVSFHCICLIKTKIYFKKRTESLDAASHLIVFLYFHKYLHCSRHHNVELNQKVWKHVLYVRFFEALLSRSCPSTETETRGKSDISLKRVCVRLIQQ